MRQLQGSAGPGTLITVVDTRATAAPPIHAPAPRSMIPRLIAALVSPAQHLGVLPVADDTGIFLYNTPAAIAGPVLESIGESNNGRTACPPYRFLAGS
eukprot:8702102-Prorocentrum_lima.AAC.1